VVVDVLILVGLMWPFCCCGSHAGCADLVRRTTIGRSVIRATLFTDAACPWAYSASPALRVIEWRFGAQLTWRLVMIGLRDQASTTSFDAARATRRSLVFRDRYGMPFGSVPKERAAATGRGCRAVVAARLLDPGAEWSVLRALQLANFNTELLLDDDERIRSALASLPGLDADAIIDRLDDEDVTNAYEADKAEARTAAGTAAEAQRKTSTSDGPVRFTAPSVVFERDGTTFVAGGWQPLLAYDVLLANLEPTLERRPPPETPGPLLEWFPDGLTTAEVAALLAEGPDYVANLDQAEQHLVQLVADAHAERIPVGQDAIWRALTTRGATSVRSASIAA
jgi:2-hydroxychromene-2-carboxylate isomerase